MAGKEWNHYIDEITSADVEFEDIRRLINDIENGKSIDHLDGEKLLTDLCNLRYRFGFFFMSCLAITSITKPKNCIHDSIRDITRAIKNLKRLRMVMREVEYAASEEGDECEGCGAKFEEPIQEGEESEPEGDEENPDEGGGEEDSGA